MIVCARTGYLISPKLPPSAALELAEDAYVDNYVYGPIGEAGGDGVKIGIEAYKQVKEYAFPQ